MASRTQVANFALGHFGEYRITDIDQNSPSAEAVRDCWDLARDSVLRAHHWNFAVGDAQLTRLASTPLVGWAFQFALPADFRRLVSCNGVLAGTRDTDHAIRGQVLVTNTDSALVEYVKNIPQTELWDPAFVEAFSFKLAELIAPRISGSVEVAQMLARRKEIAGTVAQVAGSVETRPLVRRATEGSRYQAARYGGYITDQPPS